VEFLSALVAIFYYPKLKHSYWKWFIFYLFFISLQECFWKYTSSVFEIRKQNYYAFFGIPIQYLFFYWLYALKSLKNRRLFLICSLLYLVTFIPSELYGQEIRTIYPVNLTIGSIILIVLIVLEFLKQVKNDDILRFKENKMFYINIGTGLFYVGTYPFSAFFNELLKPEHVWLWNGYYLYFLISNCLMYLLFTASFIWGKQES